MEKRKKIIVIVLFVLIFIVFFVFLLRRPAGLVSNVEDIKWGVTFSKYFTEEMGLDWKETYLAILDDLKPKSLRLPLYWQDIEAQAGIYNFADYDWLASEAQKRNVELVLIIGRKLPRWPECHLPEWAASLNERSQQTRILKLISEIAGHYKDLGNLYLWQVENEPFFPFGECSLWGAGFLDEEIKAVRTLDSAHQIIVTDSGELSLWVPAAKRADIFGTTMYRIIWNKYLGYFKYPLPPRFFWLKANLVHLFYPQKPIIVSELQLEPWGEKLLKESPLEEQVKSMNLRQFEENIAYARQAGFPEVYLWGTEWWYWLKVKHNQPEIWETAKKLISE